MQTEKTAKTEVIIACNPNAVPAENREQWIENGKQIYAEVLEAQHLPDGFRFRLPADSTTLLKVTEYISNERLCCGFLTFTLEIEPNQGPFWLALTGAVGVKDYLRSVFATNSLLNEDVAGAAGLR